MLEGVQEFFLESHSWAEDIKLYGTLFMRLLREFEELEKKRLEGIQVVLKEFIEQSNKALCADKSFF